MRRMSVRSAGTPGSRPSTQSCPRVGGSAVASRRSRVVLPAPFGPSRPVTPGARSRSTSASAQAAPNVRPTPRRLIEAVIITPPRSKFAQVTPAHEEDHGRGHGQDEIADLEPGVQHHVWRAGLRHQRPDNDEPDRADRDGRSQRTDPGRQRQDDCDETDGRQQPGVRRSARDEQPEQHHRRQRDREYRDRAQQDQPKRRVRRDQFRFERRVDPRVIAESHRKAGHERRHGEE